MPVVPKMGPIWSFPAALASMTVATIVAVCCVVPLAWLVWQVVEYPAALRGGAADGDRKVVPQADERHDPLHFAFVPFGTVQPNEQWIGVVSLVVQRGEQAMRRFMAGRR